MTDTLSTTVIAKESSDAFTPFVVKDGNVNVGTTKLVEQFNDTVVLIFEKDALRVLKTLDDVVAFGTLVTSLRNSNLVVATPASAATFMNPEDRFNDFLKDGTDLGLELTVEEKALPAIFASVKAKFTTAFTPPVPPRTLAPEPTYTTAQQAWLDNRSVRDITNVAGPDNYRMLRVGYGKTGEPTRLWSSGGYSVTIRAAKLLWDRHLRVEWRFAPVSGSRLKSYVSITGISRNANVYGDRVEIGCQSISRPAIERVARLLNWDM